jgi:hypothetical protein
MKKKERVREREMGKIGKGERERWGDGEKVK